MSIRGTTSRMMVVASICIVLAGVCCLTAGILIFRMEQIRPEFLRYLFFMMFWNISGFLYLTMLMDEIDDGLSFIIAMQFGPFILLAVLSERVDWEYWRIKFMVRSNLPLYVDKDFKSERARDLLHRRLKG